MSGTVASAESRLPHTVVSLRAAVFEALGAASMCWDNPAGAGVFQSERALDIGERLFTSIVDLTGMGEPHLGCATTGDLLDEVRVRVEVSGELGYRTITSDTR